MLTARTVPVVLDIARRMETLCPAAPLLIFSNPITNLVDAVTRYTNTGAIGLCSGVYNVAWDLDHLFGVGAPNPDLSYRGGGLNHLSWILPSSWSIVSIPRSALSSLVPCPVSYEWGRHSRRGRPRS